MVICQLIKQVDKQNIKAGITQLVRVLDCDSKSHGFKSRYSPNFIIKMTHLFGTYITEKSILISLSNIYGLGTKSVQKYVNLWVSIPKLALTS